MVVLLFVQPLTGLEVQEGIFPRVKTRGYSCSSLRDISGGEGPILRRFPRVAPFGLTLGCYIMPLQGGVDCQIWISEGCGSVVVEVRGVMRSRKTVRASGANNVL